mgnify:CR=1 FL=1
MTRKRFAKLMMGLGLGRNSSNLLTKSKYTYHKSYAEAWNDYASTLSHNLRTYLTCGESCAEIFIRDVDYLEAHRNER